MHSQVTIKIKAYAKVLKMGASTEISITDDDINFNVVGTFLGLFKANVSLNAPYGELSKITETEFQVRI